MPLNNMAAPTSALQPLDCLTTWERQKIGKGARDKVCTAWEPHAGVSWLAAPGAGLPPETCHEHAASWLASNHDCGAGGLQDLLNNPQPLFALVLSPTRELAIQIAEQAEALGAGIALRTAVLVGGINMMDQALHLGKRPHIIVGTPGRVVDHLSNTKVCPLAPLPPPPPPQRGPSSCPPVPGRTGQLLVWHLSRADVT